MSLTADRNTIRRNSDEFFYPIEASTQVYKGQCLCLNAARNAVPASLTTGLISVGVSEQQVNNTGAAGALYVQTRIGCFKLGNHGSITKSSIGSFVYFFDDQSVQTSGSGASIAGVLVDIDPRDQGCWVDMYPSESLAAPSGALIAANNLSDVTTASTALNNLLGGNGMTSTTRGLDSATAAALAIGATNATTVNIGATATPVAITSAGAVSIPSTLAVTGATTATGAVFANGGLDRSTAASLLIGATNATSVVITPATTVTGLLGANGGVDRTSAAALAIGATNATTINIGATANPVAITASTGATAFPQNITVTGTSTITGTEFPNGGIDRSTAAALAIGATNATQVNIGATATAVSITSAGALTAPGAIKSSGTGGVGYATGAGGTVTQLTSRTTGVTLSKTSGQITLFSAAGSATPATFTVTNTLVAATDVVIINQVSGTNLYEAFVTAVTGGSYNVTFFTTGGTATDSPVFNVVVVKGVAS